MLVFIIGVLALALGHFITMDDIERKVKSGMTPYLSEIGTLEWEEKKDDTGTKSDGVGSTYA